MTLTKTEIEILLKLLEILDYLLTMRTSGDCSIEDDPLQLMIEKLKGEEISIDKLEELNSKLSTTCFKF